MKKILNFVISAIFLFAFSSIQAGTLDDVKSRGELNCIVSTGLTGFAAPDDKGSGEVLMLNFVEQLQPQYLVMR